MGIISYKWVDMQEHSGLLDLERGQLAEIRPDYWQTDTSVSNKSWGYIENDTFKTPIFVIDQLADVVSKNGNLLLNIGPRADGTIPDPVQSVLKSVGAWLKVNGDAIYGTRPWRVYGEGPTKVAEGSFHDTDTQAFTAQDFRFTTKGKNLFAIELGWPASGEATIHSLGQSGLTGRQIRSVEMLGTKQALRFEQKPDGLHVTLPVKPLGESAYVLRVELDGPAQTDPKFQ